MKNYKINTNREPLSEADIQAGQNFEQVLKGYKAIKPPFYKAAKFWFGSGAVLVATVAAVLLFKGLNPADNLSEPTRNFIQPPIAEADITYTTYNLVAGTDSVLEYKTGSKINVPANAFTDENGNVVKGPVQLSYREFHDIADVFLAGIPMTYDSAGETYHFETAGMMDISASQNGKPLRTNPQALITVQLASKNQEDRFNSYYLDTVAKQWVYLANSNYPVASEALNQTDSLPASAMPVQAPKTSNDAQLKAQSPAYRKVCEEIAEVEKEKPVAPKKAEKKKPRFSIKVDEKEFPELSAYNNLKFQVVDETGYDPKKANVVWEDVQLKRVAGTLNYEITFIKRTETYSVIAAPAVDEKDYEAAKKVFDEKYAEYTQKLAERKAEQARLKKEWEEKAKAIEAQIQKEVEAQKQRIKEYEARLDQSNLFYRTLQVNQFGTFNCDCPQRLPQGGEVVAEFTDKKTGQPLKIGTAYLVEKGRNLMFSYYPDGLSRFRFDPKQTNLVWAVTTDQRVCIVNAEEFKAATEDKAKGNFKAEVVERKFSSSEEVKEYLNI
ncbi:MAG: hypothetical protein U0T75_05785 [Chitinophagales bacterium]